jgi:hypothetical protein
MSSFKKLNKADVTTVPYAANKQWWLNYDSSSLNGDSRISIYKGTYITGPFTPNDVSIDPITNGQYERLVFDSINHLFYQSYSGSLLDTGSLMFNINTYESASQQRPSASYFDYNNNPFLFKSLPTEVGQGIRVLVINQDTYGSKILPHSFSLSSSAYYIKDDGYGNLFDVSGTEDDYINLLYLQQSFYFNDPTPGVGLKFVGNIFYSHGIVTITAPSYQEMFPLPPLAQGNSGRFYPNDVNKTINILGNDISRTGTLDTGSIVLYGPNAQYYTINSNGTLTLNTSVPGDYTVTYTINSVFGSNNESSLTSNPATVSVNIQSLPECSTYNIIATREKIGSQISYIPCGGTSTITETVPFNKVGITRCIKNPSLTLLDAYSIVTNKGSCFPPDCSTYTISCVQGIYQVDYLDCTGTAQQIKAIDPSQPPQDICAQVGSVIPTLIKLLGKEPSFIATLGSACATVPEGVGCFTWNINIVGNSSYVVTWNDCNKNQTSQTFGPVKGGSLAGSVCAIARPTAAPTGFVTQGDSITFTNTIVACK